MRSGVVFHGRRGDHCGVPAQELATDTSAVAASCIGCRVQIVSRLPVRTTGHLSRRAYEGAETGEEKMQTTESTSCNLQNSAAIASGD